jgi:hypothetical protein
VATHLPITVYSKLKHYTGSEQRNVGHFFDTKLVCFISSQTTFDFRFITWPFYVLFVNIYKIFQGQSDLGRTRSSRLLPPLLPNLGEQVQVHISTYWRHYVYWGNVKMIHLLNVEWPNTERPNVERLNIQWLNIEWLNVESDTTSNRDPTTNDWTSNRIQSRKTEHRIWTSKAERRKIPQLHIMHHCWIFEVGSYSRLGVTFSKFSRLQVGSFEVQSFERPNFERSNLGTTELRTTQLRATDLQKWLNVEYDFQLRI